MAKKTTKIQEPILEAPVEEKKFIGTATTRVNVRAEAKIEAAISSVLNKNEVVNVVTDKPVNGFYKIENGYVMKEYLVVKEA